MNSSDYVPVNKKKYIHRLIELEAENKALRRKIHVYEELLHRKISSNNKKPTNTIPFNDPTKPVICQNNQNDLHEMSDGFKESAQKFLNNPDENENIVSSLVQHMITPKNHSNITKEHVKIFLHDF